MPFPSHFISTNKRTVIRLLAHKNVLIRFLAVAVVGLAYKSILF